MKNIISNTCIKYRPKIDAKDKDWMEIKKTKDGGCFSNPSR